MTYITPKIIKTWGRSGKKKIIKIFENSPDKHQNLFLELICQTVDGSLTEDQFVEVIPKPLPNEKLFVNVLWTLDFRFVKLKAPEVSEDRKIFISLIKTLTQKNIVKIETLKEHLKISTLDDLQLIMEKLYKTHNSARVTDMFYCQKKFNLLSEQSEGYAKLLNEFLQTPSIVRKDHSDWIKRKTEKIRQLIGAFLLDPNRVLDVLLDVFESHMKMHKKPLLEIIRNLYNHEKHRNDLILTYLGIKFQWYYTNQNLENTPNSLYRITSALIINNMLQIKDIFPYLMPHNQEYKKQIIKNIRDREKKVSLPFPYSQKILLWRTLTKDNGKKESLSFLFAMAADLPFPCYDRDEITSPLLDMLYRIVEPLYQRVSLTTKMKHFRIVWSFSEADHHIFQNEIFPLVYHLSSTLGLDSELLIMIVRLLKGYFKKDQNRDPNSKYNPDSVVPICARLFAGMAGTRAPIFSLANDIWEILNNFNFKKRYDIYGTVVQLTNIDPFLERSFKKAEFNSSFIFKRVVKDTVVESGRAICKVFVKNPLACVTKVVSQLGYPVFVDLLVDMIKFSNKMTRDILIYRILSRLSDFSGISGEVNIDKVSNVDGYSPSDVLKNYGTFIGKLCAKFDNINFYPIFEFITREGSLGSWQDLYLLRQIIQNVSFEEIYDDIKPDQVESLCGGHILRIENSFFSVEDNTSEFGNRIRQQEEPNYRLIERKQTNIRRLAQWMVWNDSSVAHNLLKVLAKLRKHSLLVRHEDMPSTGKVNTEKMRIKRTLYCIDKCQETFLILVQFLKYHTKFIWDGKKATKQGVYYFKIPSIKQLVSWGIDNEMFFKVVHPGLYAMEELMEQEEEKKMEDEEIEGEGEDESSEPSKSTKSKEKTNNDIKSENENKEDGEDTKTSKIELKDLGTHKNPVLRYFHTFFDALPSLVDIVHPSIFNPSLTTPTAAIFYILFWSLDVYDIHVPSQTYKKTREKLKAKLQKYQNTSRHLHQEVISSYKSVLANLEKEELKQIEHVNKVKEALTILRKARIWDTLSGELDIDWFLQTCLYPRMKLSTSDAVYCARFVETVLVSLPALRKKTNPDNIYFYFNYKKYLIKICTLLPSLFRFCSEYESMRIARYVTYFFRFLRKKREKFTKVYRTIKWLSGLGYEARKNFAIRYIKTFVNIEEVVIRKTMLRVLDEMKSEFPEYHINGDLIVQNLRKYENEILKDNEEAEALFKSYVGFLEKRLKDKILIQEIPKKRITRRPNKTKKPSTTTTTTTTTTKKQPVGNNNNKVSNNTGMAKTSVTRKLVTTQIGSGLKVTQMKKEEPVRRRVLSRRVVSKKQIDINADKGVGIPTKRKRGDGEEKKLNDPNKGLIVTQKKEEEKKDQPPKKKRKIQRPPSVKRKASIIKDKDKKTENKKE